MPATWASCSAWVFDRGDVGGPVLLLELGVTTSAARGALRRHARARPLEAAPHVVLLSGDGDWTLREPESTPARAVRGIPLMVGALMIVLAVSARLVADWERAACARADCAQRPATYGDALYWLLNRPSGGDPEGLGAATFQARSIGLVVALASVVLLGWVVATLLLQAVSRAQTTGSDLVARANRRAAAPSLPASGGAAVPPGAPRPGSPSMTPAAGVQRSSRTVVAAAGALVAGVWIGAALARRADQDPGGSECSAGVISSAGRASPPR